MTVLPDDVRRVYESMKRRCNSNREPYKDVSICEEWKNDFKAFSEWYYKNLWKCKEPLQIDKDLLSPKGAKMYSPETCCLLPRSLNVFLAGKRRKNGLPIGVVKNGNYYRAQVNFMGGHVAKTFDNLEDAKNFYVFHKKRYLKMFITVIKNDAPQYVIDALELYEFE
jgi:hypothetical protein